MTAIIGWIDEEEDKVWVGADSAGSDGELSFIRSDSKVFQAGEFLIGGAGSFRMIQLLRYGLTEENKGLAHLKIPKSCKDLQMFMVQKFIPLVKDVFEKGCYLTKIEGVDSMDGEFIVGVRNKIFSVDSDFQVGGYENYMAIGSGNHLCLGACKLAWDAGYPAEEAIREALEAASFFGMGVDKPFILINNG